MFEFLFRHMMQTIVASMQVGLIPLSQKGLLTNDAVGQDNCSSMYSSKDR